MQLSLCAQPQGISPAGGRRRRSWEGRQTAREGSTVLRLRCSGCRPTNISVFPRPSVRLIPLLPRPMEGERWKRPRTRKARDAVVEPTTSHQVGRRPLVQATVGPGEHFEEGRRSHVSKGSLVVGSSPVDLVLGSSALQTSPRTDRSETLIAVIGTALIVGMPPPSRSGVWDSTSSLDLSPTAVRGIGPILGTSTVELGPPIRETVNKRTRCVSLPSQYRSEVANFLMERSDSRW